MVTKLAGLMNSHSLTEFDGFEIFNVDATRKTKIFDKKLSFGVFVHIDPLVRKGLMTLVLFQYLAPGGLLKTASGLWRK